jgi:SAM-dependent methyltransferase
MLGKRIRSALETPATRGLPVDDPHTTLARRDVLRRKAFLRKIYLEWYDLILAALPEGPGRVLELGSGAAFLKDLLPPLVTSEVVAWEGVSLVADARSLPLAEASLKAIVMTNVFHHLGDARAFLRGATRAVRPGGVIAMVEPWVTAWSRIVYARLHEEPFQPDTRSWEFDATGPLSGANGALPWIVFERDREPFHEEFPQWRVETIEPLMPLRYLLSGGMSMRSLMPGAAFGFWRTVERAASPIMDRVAMFAAIVLRRQEASPRFGA